MASKVIFLALISLMISSSRTQLYSSNKNELLTVCPHLYQKVFRGYVPRGNLSAGMYSAVENIDKLKDCVFECCLQDKCHVALMKDTKCYHVTCKTDELCLPILSSNTETLDHVSMVLVRPTDQDTWEDVLREQELSSENFYTERKLEDTYNDLIMDESVMPFGLVSCNVGIDNMCAINEECIQNSPKSRAGTCHCKDGFMKSLDGECIINLKNAAIRENENADFITDRIISSATNLTKRELNVTAESKVVRLPQAEVMLKADVSPVAVGDEKYQYEWTLLQQPQGSTAVREQNGDQLQLSTLSEGLYTFKISVSSVDGYGETFVNVTVLPPSRVNKPPQIVIIPANQTVKLPNTGAVLDASSSTDDDGIVSWHWELQQGPLGYQPQLQDSPTLQLNDLTRPGNYTFKLTVTDTDKATSTALANITVLKIVDYPPEANAGQDVIVYLPRNQLTLSGNLSTDDHAITTWEWTKSPGDADKAVDMQNTRTPYLQLSNLEEGMYTFTLKVTDSANQSSTAEVHVFVKPPTNQPPVADAGNNITISLPQTWVVLDAENSTDDNKIVAYLWEAIDGPSNVIVMHANGSRTNVTGLTKGGYTFKLTVTDDNGNVASDFAYVVVNQNKNQKPTANAGGNFEIDLPRNAIFLNGSKSSDDWAITKWKWTRDDSSISLGNIAEKSDESPILILTDVSVGKYFFNLTVYDEQGLFDSDTVVFTVNNDPKLYYLIEITINVEANKLTELQFNNLKGKLALLVKDGTRLQVRGVKPEAATGKSVILFYVENSEGKPLPANEVVEYLRQKLKVDAGILGFSVASLKTTVCQNSCSGHGVCDEQTRECICEAFWMKNVLNVYFGDGDSDCSWSILYVVLGVLCLLIFIIASFWSLAYFCLSWCSRRQITTKPTNYKLIEDTDDLPPYATRKGNISDSDTDSDVVFESRTKSASRFSGDSRNGHKLRNGYGKLGRRVKT